MVCYHTLGHEFNPSPMLVNTWNASVQKDLAAVLATIRATGVILEMDLMTPLRASNEVHWWGIHPDVSISGGVFFLHEWKKNPFFTDTYWGSVSGYYINKYYFPIFIPVGIVENILSFLVSIFDCSTTINNKEWTHGPVSKTLDLL